MVQQYKQKEEVRIQMEMLDRQELEKIAHYQSRLDQRDKQQKIELMKKEKEKEAIYLKLKAAEEERKKQLEQIEQIRMEYYQFMKEE